MYIAFKYVMFYLGKRISLPKIKVHWRCLSVLRSLAGWPRLMWFSNNNNNNNNNDDNYNSNNNSKNNNKIIYLAP